MAFDKYWGRFPARTKRMLTILIFFFISLIVTVAGVLTPLSSEEAETLSKELDQRRESIKEMDILQSTSSILGNNFMICLLSFTPIAGPIFGFLVLYSTGVVIAADSIAHGFHPLLGFISLFILPIVWMEFCAYSMAFAESTWLTWLIIKGKGRNELRKTCIFIAICAVVLLAAAFIEALLIQYLM